MDAIRSAVNAFSKGEIDERVLRAVIGKVIAGDPAEATHVRSTLAQLVQQGTLPASVLDEPSHDETVERTRTSARRPGGTPHEAVSKLDETLLSSPKSPVLETLVRAPRAVTMAPPLPASPPPAAPTRAPALLESASGSASQFGEGYALRGRYVLQSMIGKGAMGQVWKAKDLLGEEAKYRDPFVAIKVLNSDFEQHPQAFVAMHREATRAQQLAHPNVVTVHVFDRDDTCGRAFIAMELLDGEPLDRVIRGTHGNGLPLNQARSIIKGMAEGLAYAHRSGIVHSDFKPANVFLTSAGIAKVLDFGIARAAKQADANIVDDSVMSGYTVTYASPQMLAEEDPDTADDVFALGAVAYELASGVHPFGRCRADEARDRKLKPKPIKGLSRREWCAIEKALAFERAQRFPDAGAFVKALQGVTKLQIGLAAAVVVLGILASVLWYRNYLERQPAIPLEQLPVAQQQEIRSQLEQGALGLRLLEQSHDTALLDPIGQRYSDAYRLHPRNPDAVAGLERVADLMIAEAEKMPPPRALDELKKLRAKSDYYTKYEPLTRALKRFEPH